MIERGIGWPKQTHNQGISDEVAHNYMIDHGVPTWGQIASTLEAEPDCERLISFWHFVDCQYRKGEQVCAAPQHLPSCPLPQQRLRKGNLNQLAYSLYLFVRDVAHCDLGGWIDAQLMAADEANGPNRVDRMREALLTRLKGNFGVSDKVLNMVFAEFLLGAGRRGSRWAEVGGSMIAIDTLVHNFLQRTGQVACGFTRGHSALHEPRRGGVAQRVGTVSIRESAADLLEAVSK